MRSERLRRKRNFGKTFVTRLKEQESQYRDVNFVNLGVSITDKPFDMGGVLTRRTLSLFGINVVKGDT